MVILHVTLASTEAHEELIYAMAAERAVSRRIADPRKQDISRQPGEGYQRQVNFQVQKRRMTL